MERWVTLEVLLEGLRDFGVSVATLRYYRKLKLVPPPQRHYAGGRCGMMSRWDSDGVKDRVREIRRLQAEGKSLEEIAAMLKGEP